MEMMRNPAMRLEMQRQQDRAMSNVESMPGGFNMLSQMYANFQAPMENALRSQMQGQQQQQQQQQQGSQTAQGEGAAQGDNPFAALLPGAGVGGLQ